MTRLIIADRIRAKKRRLLEDRFRLACHIIYSLTALGREEPYQRWVDECLAEAGLPRNPRFRRLTIANPY